VCLSAKGLLDGIVPRMPLAVNGSRYMGKYGYETRSCVGERAREDSLLLLSNALCMGTAPVTDRTLANRNIISVTDQVRSSVPTLCIQ
jgi:hypothetical protein